jgi:tRNA(Ile)-lysidine synthase
LGYLAELNQDFRIDATNDDRQFTRNLLRHEVLPDLRRIRPEVDAALLRLAGQAAEAQAWISAEARHLAEQCVRADSPDCWVVEVRSLLQSPPLLIREVFKAAWESAGWPRQEMGFAEWQLLAELAAAEMATSSVNLPGGVRAVRQQGCIRLKRGPSVS